jgi:4-hydroxyphenylpyruvate dioxygenase
MASFAASSRHYPPSSSSSLSTPPSHASDDPDIGTDTDSSLAMYRGYDHIHWYVGNAKQAALYYVSQFGFRHLAYRGLETGSRVLASHVVRNGEITFVLTSPLRARGCGQEEAGGKGERWSDEENEVLNEVHDHLEKHGDGVKDVSLAVDSVDTVFDAAVRGGAVVVSAPRTLRDKPDAAVGEVRLATIKTYGDTTHTLVERRDYSGPFLPGYRPAIHRSDDAIEAFLPLVHFDAVDHCVGNQNWGEMDQICE